MTAFAISVVLAAPIYFGLRIPFPPEAFLLAVVVYVWLMDLFSETGRPNLTWMILWLGIIAAFTAILLSGFRLEKEDQIQRDIALQLSRTDGAFLSEYLRMQHSSGLQPLIAPHTLPGLPQMAELENLEFALYTGGLLTDQSPG
ncbi:hypothetical protein RZS08_33015, partial [Arthrospira platensis SPKY1]|nr:hypothetical protein [Arthrospira platensis SPKY1]